MTYPFTEQMRFLRTEANHLFNTGKVSDKAMWDCATVVLDQSRLPVWVGALGDKHHCEIGGLVQHIEEVWRIAKAMTAVTNPVAYSGENINIQTLFLAVLFHDFGKLWDYEPILNLNCEGIDPYRNEEWLKHRIIGWRGTPHKRRINHVSRSNMQWIAAANEYRIDGEIVDDISHAILSHHGCREWGSPVSPNTPMAWVLHLADMASARLDECARGVDHLSAHKE